MKDVVSFFIFSGADFLLFYTSLPQQKGREWKGFRVLAMLKGVHKN